MKKINSGKYIESNVLKFNDGWPKAHEKLKEMCEN